MRFGDLEGFHNEYRTLDLNPASAKIAGVDLLNDAGRDGWRLVLILPNGIAYLERQIKSAAKR